MKKLKIKSKRISIIELSFSSFLKYNNCNVSFIYGGYFVESKLIIDEQRATTLFDAYCSS